MWTVCNSGEAGDEFHYLLNCLNENVKRNRTKHVEKYYTHPNVPRFCSFMNMTSKSKHVKLARVISCILELFLKLFHLGGPGYSQQLCV